MKDPHQDYRAIHHVSINHLLPAGLAGFEQGADQAKGLGFQYSCARGWKNASSCSLQCRTAVNQTESHAVGMEFIPGPFMPMDLVNPITPDLAEE